MGLKKYIYVTVLIVFSVHVQSNAQYEYLLDIPYAQLAPTFDTVVFKKLRNLPQASFQKEISIIKATAKKHNDAQLFMEARLHEWYYLNVNKLHKSLDSSLQLLELLLQEAIDKKLTYYVTLIRFEIALAYFYEFHDYEAAFTRFIVNFPDVMNVSSAEMPTKKAIIMHTGNVYYNFGDYFNAKKYISIADTVYFAWRPRVALQCKNTLGLIHREWGNYDSAIYYFQQGIDLAKLNGSDIWVAILSGNIGITYYLQGEYDEAIPLLKKDIDKCLEYGSFDNGINSIIKLISAYMTVGERELAEQEMKRGWKYVDSMFDKVKHLPGLYTAQAKLKIASGEYKEAHRYRDSASKYRDSLLKRDNTYQLSKVQNRLKQELHDKEVESLLIEKRLISTTRNALLGAVALIGIIAYLVVNRQRTKTQLLKSQKSFAIAELQNATHELESYTKSLQEKNALIEKSVKEIERLHKEREEIEVQESNNEILQQLYSSTILTDDEWMEFKMLFDKVHKGYILRLKEKYPDLSPADIRFVVLSKLKLNNKEMAGILGVRSDSIRTYKHRLRKKFNLPEDSSLTLIIDSI